VAQRKRAALRIIAGILLIKARTAKSEEMRPQLQEARQRVTSMAAMQEHLHVSKPGANETHRVNGRARIGVDTAGKTAVEKLESSV
jgi:two-component sensor histidine kinase